jgi:tetratricopeptide (TPR) repeat protein
MTQTPGDAPSGGQPPSGRQRPPRIWGSEVPWRNLHFTGREPEIQALRVQLGSEFQAANRRPPCVLYGLGGVGKTEIATEYAHRYADDYEIVWWVRADQEDTIQASLVGLGTRLQLPSVNPVDRDRAIPLVIGALQSGEPHSRWLLIFDDVAAPEKIRQYIPRGGHVIVTSRINEWKQVLSTDGIEVTQFGRADTVSFLRQRVPQLRPSADAAAETSAATNADRLADALGDLPLAAEHAASYLTQTGLSVGEYIEAFERDAHTLLGEGIDMYSTNAAVATTWSVTRQTLSPEAKNLFQLLAFFAAEPISEENLIQPGRVALDPALPVPLQKVLSSRSDLKKAQRELARFSLLSLYGQRNVVQLHRVVQAVTRARTEKDDPVLARTLERTVFALLAATDPDAPEKEQNDPIYARTIHHLVPTGALKSDDRLVRNLIINQVRRLRLRGGNREALSLGELALAAWRSAPDDIQTLAMAVEVAWAKRDLGDVDEAFALNADTLQRLREHHGEEDDTYLICANSYGVDLRMIGKYDEALEHDLSLLPVVERVFGADSFRSLNLSNNIAIDLRCVGRYTDALEYDNYVAGTRERQFGANDRNIASSKFGMAKDLRRLGRYDEALEVARETTDLMEARNEPWNQLRLLMFGGLAVSLRRVGYYAEARNLAEDTYRRFVEYLGAEHRATLQMATSLMCDRRVVDELGPAAELGRATVAAYEKIAGQGHPNTLIAKANFAVILRAQEYLSAAQEVNQAALEGHRRLYAYDHPNTLIVMTNLASDLAAVGDVRQAREIGEEVVVKSREIRGPRHPGTLAAAANLALDRRATGDADAARELEAEALAGYDSTLTLEHPQARIASQRGRVSVDIESVMP